MALRYEVKSKRSGFANHQTTRYYPVLTRRSVADIQMICEEISAATTLTSADVVAVVEALTVVIPNLIEDGFNVKLDNLGTFSVHAKSEGKEDPQKVTVRDIKELKMSFLPSKRIKQRMRTMKVEKQSDRS